MNSPATVYVAVVYVAVHEIVKTFITSGQEKIQRQKKQKPLYLEQNEASFSKIQKSEC